MRGRRRGVLEAAGAGGLGALGAVLAGCARPGLTQPSAETAPASAILPAVRLFVFPDDGIAPLLDLLETASRQLDLYIFELDSTEIERRVTDAVRRGVRVRAIVEPNPAGRAVQASQTMARLRRAGVHVKPAGRPFSKTHAKVVMVDGAQAWVGTGNLVDAWRERRDYGILTRQSETVRAVARIFEEDWLGVSSALPASPVGSIVAAGTPRSPVDPRANVVASPQNGRAAVTAFVTAARWSLYVEHDQLEDLAVLDTLARRSRAGVDVRVVLSDGEAGKRAARSLQLRAPEIRVRLLAEPHVHAKLIVADEARLLVGSHNLTKESLDSRREIGLIVEDAEAVGTAVGVFRRDFEGIGETDGGQLVPMAVTERQPFLRGFVAGALLPGAAALVWALRGEHS